MDNLQYLVSGLLSFSVSTYILVKRPRTTALKSLCLYGLMVSLWEVSSYFHSETLDPAVAAVFFRIVLLSSHLCFPLYMLTILNIQQTIRRKMLLLILTPTILQVLMMAQNSYFANYEMFYTESGWSYRVISYQLPLILVGTIFVGYLIGNVIILFRLTRNTSLPLLKRKYLILLLSFTLFQAVGTTIINALIALNLLSPSIRVGGILQFLTFLSIWYALTIKEKEIPLSPSQYQSFSQIYSSFLTIFYNSTVDSQLGEKVVLFRQFLHHSQIETNVSFTNSMIVYTEEEDFNTDQLLTRNLDFFEKHPVDCDVTDHYLRILKVASEKLNWGFEQVLLSHEAFLKKSDLIYGLSKGDFLKKIMDDNSLQDLDDTNACLKLYKRILLPLVDVLHTKLDLQEKFTQHPVTEALTITDFGEVSFDGVLNHVLTAPKTQRVALIIDGFNSLLSRIYEAVLLDHEIDITSILEKLRLVLTLNRDKAIDLGVYPALLGTLATKIPRTQIYKLYSDYLEEIVQEKTKALEDAQGKLLDAQRLAAIGEAAAIVGHDLRNPLQVITYALSFADQRMATTQDDDFRETLETIKEQVRYMNKIVSDLQDYARPLKPKFVETRLLELINETLSTLTIPNTVKVTLRVDEEAASQVLMTDAFMIKRVFINLITNAVQAMPKGGQLTIRLAATKENAVISIQDTGVGIPDEQKSQIFQPLFTTKAKGQGLGLTVCKRLIEANEGHITFTSTVGVGATFTVTLPLIHHAVDERQAVDQSLVTHP